MATIIEKAGRRSRRVVQKQAEKLGLDNRMNLAKSYNRWRNRSFIDFRQQLLQDPAYLAHTSGVEAFYLRDGWCAAGDALSFANHPLLADAEAILSEDRKVESLKGFMVNHLARKDIGTHTSFIDAALHPKVLKTAAVHLGMYPILSSVKLLVSAPGRYDQFGSSQLYHLDHADRPLLKMIINVGPVTGDSGPFCFLPAPVSKSAKRTLDYGRRGGKYRVTDDTMYGVVDRNARVELTGARGDVAFVDTSQCFHYGSRNATSERRILMYSFSTPARTDFREPVDYSTALPCRTLLQKALLDPYFKGNLSS